MFQKWNTGQKWVNSGATCDTFFSCSGFQHHIYKFALHEYWPMSSGDALISSWPTLVWRGHRPQEGGGCVRA
jgi:hypothetical protein